MRNISKFRLSSLAIVAANKSMSSTKILATPIESMTMLDGEITSLPTDESVQGVDAEGNNYQSKVTTDTAVEAEWFPLGMDGRRTPPDVRRGEEVMLLQYGDTDEYYWMSTGRKNHLRKLETLVYTIAATTDESVDSTDPANCYTLEISSHTGQISLRTTKNHQEHCEYGFQFNLNEGLVQLADDLGNEFVFDSKNTVLRLKNADGSFLELDKKMLNAYAPDSMDIAAENTIALEAGQSITAKTQTYTIDTTTYALTSDTNTIDSQSTTVKGSVEFMGAVRFHQAITANGITSSSPIRGPFDTI